jgi:hypothetical protein
MLRRLVPVALALGVVASSMSVAQAAPKTTALYFVNNGAPADGGCTLALALSLKPQDGNECSGTIGGVDGNGVFSDDSYSSSKTSFRLDVSRPLTGTVFVSHFPLVFASVGPVGSPHSLPGYVTLDITYKIDSVKIGTQHIDGVVMPVDGLKAPFSFAIPSSLKNKTVKKVTAAITWTTAAGLSGISYTDPYASVINLPVK